MKFILPAVLLFATILVANAQTVIEQAIGDSLCYEEGYGSVKLNGGYLISAAKKCQANPSDWRAWLIKLSNNGDTLWTKQGEVYNGFLKKIDANNLLFIGRERAALNTDTTLIHLTDTNGIVKWKNSISLGACNTQAYDAVRLNNGYYLVCGFYSTTACNSENFDAFIRLIDAFGNTIWTQPYDFNGDDQLYSIAELNNGQFAAYGWTNGEGAGGGDALLLITDSTGNELDHKTYGTVDNERAYGMCTLPDGFAFVYHGDSTKVVKADFQGNINWQKTSGDACGSAYFKTIHTKDKRIGVLAFESIGGNCKSTLSMLDGTGNIVWKKHWNGLFREVKEISAGSFLLTGYRNIPTDVYFARFDTTFGDTSTAIQVLNAYHPSVNIFPNPNNGSFTIKAQGLSEIDIYNNLGQKVQHSIFYSTTQYKTDIEQQGIFYIFIKTKHGISHHKILIK